MSYNITQWKTKELKDLAIPVSAFYEHERTDWHPERQTTADGVTTQLNVMESTITGKVVDGILLVESINIRGEGSGTAMNWIIQDAFAKSKGRLVAVAIWEGGDSVERLVVDNGVVTWENVDL